MSDLLQRLIEAGTPGHLVAEVAKELARAEVEREAIEARRAADRERQARRRGNVTSRDTADVTGATPFPAPPNENNLTPPTHTPEKQTPRARGTTIPVDWKPKPFGVGTVARSIVDGWPPGSIDEQAEHFASHHRAKGTVSKDWHDSWSTWVHNSKRFKGSSNGQSPQRNGPASTIDAVQRAIELTGGSPGCDPAGSFGSDSRIGQVPDPMRAIGHVQR
jgi:hypothetical protein